MNHDNRDTARTTPREVRRLSAWELSRVLRPRRRSQVHVTRARLQPNDARYLACASRYKLFTVGQLQRRFALAERTAYRAIERLRIARFIKPLLVRVNSPDWPACYYVKGRGIAYLGEELHRSGHPVPPGLKPGRWHSRASVATTSLHDLAITEFGIAVERTVEERSGLDLVYTESRYSVPGSKLLLWHNGVRRAFVPDLGFITAATSRKPAALTLTWLEVDLASESNPVVRDKRWRYHAYARSSVGWRRIKRLYDQCGPGLRHHAWRIAVVVHDPLRDGGDDRRLARFTAQALRLPAATRNRIRITTAAARSRSVDSPQPLGEEAWIKLYDVRWQIHDFRRFAAAVDGTGCAEQRQRVYVERLLANVPRHEFFPWTQSTPVSSDGLLMYQRDAERLAQAI